MNYKWQIGQFLIFLGAIALVVFSITDQVGRPLYAFFCPGLIGILLGGYLMWLGRKPTTRAKRFRLFRRSPGPDDKEES